MDLEEAFDHRDTEAQSWKAREKTWMTSSSLWRNRIIQQHIIFSVSLCLRG